MQIFKTKLFSRWAEKEGLEDEALQTTVEELENGLVDADLGAMSTRSVSAWRAVASGVARELRSLSASGKRPSSSMASSRMSAPTSAIRILKALRLLVGVLLDYTDVALTMAVKAGELIEVVNNDD